MMLTPQKNTPIGNAAPSQNKEIRLLPNADGGTGSQTTLAAVSRVFGI